MGRTAGLVRADGEEITLAESSDLVVIQKRDVNTNQFTPRVIQVDNLVSNTSFSNITTSGNLTCDTIGGGLVIKTGTNARAGRATLVAGTVTVANTSVTANTLIMLTVQTLGGAATPQALRISNVTANTSFTITSASGADTSTVAWHLIELIP